MGKSQSYRRKISTCESRQRAQLSRRPPRRSSRRVQKSEGRRPAQVEAHWKSKLLQSEQLRRDEIFGKARRAFIEKSLQNCKEDDFNQEPKESPSSKQDDINNQTENQCGEITV